MKAKRVVLIGAYTALIVGAQLVLSGVVGVEIVTVMIAAFAYAFGRADGVVLAIAFSLLRALVFGFFPTAMLLYLAYYPLLALWFGFLGRNKKFFPKEHALAVLSAIAITPLFTAMDNLITPLYYGYTRTLFRLYHIASVPVLIAHEISVAVSVFFLFPPLVKVFYRFLASANRS